MFEVRENLSYIPGEDVVGGVLQGLLQGDYQRQSL